MSNSSLQLKLGAVLSYLAIRKNAISFLLYTPWMVHSIGRENNSLYIWTYFVITLVVFDFGLGI